MYISSLIVQATSAQGLKKAQMLSDMHIRNLKEKILMLSRAEVAAQQLEVQVWMLSFIHFLPRFTIHFHLRRIGLLYFVFI